MNRPLCICLLAGLLGAPASRSRAASPVKATIPTKEQVGAANLPDRIAPVLAPFAMPQFTKPQFPTNVVTILAYGARENESATTAIQSAINIRSRDAGISLLDGRGLSFEGVVFNVPNDLTASLKGEATGAIRFRNCTPEKPKGWDTNSR